MGGARFYCLSSFQVFAQRPRSFRLLVLSRAMLGSCAGADAPLAAYTHHIRDSGRHFVCYRRQWYVPFGYLTIPTVTVSYVSNNMRSLFNSTKNAIILQHNFQYHLRC